MSLLTHILAEYYNAIDDIEEATPESHIQKALPHIAVLYHKLALLHPFADGNSRTRNTVLQTELVRQGGHPTVLWDNYWGITEAKSWEEAQEYVLDGWCSWEIAYQTGASPFLPFV